VQSIYYGQSLISIPGNTGNQRNNGEQKQRTIDQRNTGEQQHRNIGEQQHRNTREQQHKNASRSNVDQSHARSNLICFSGNNGDQLHKRKRSSHIFYTRKEHGQKRSAKQKEENQFFQSKTSEDNCGLCKKLAGCDFWILCDFCERWFHGDCVGVTEEDSKSIGKFECPLCKQGQKKRHRAKETKT